MQVYIDGIPQLESPSHVNKPKEFQVPPKTPNFDKERAETIKHEGLPPLSAKSTAKDTVVVFTNVSSIWTKRFDGVLAINRLEEQSHPGLVVVKDGKITCVGEDCARDGFDAVEALFVDLQGGSISPGLVSYGTNLGLQEIASESSTNDGVVYDSFLRTAPGIIGGDSAVIRAVDGLQFSTRDEL